MEPEEPLDEIAFFGAIVCAKLRVLLIGRRALVALGAPVMTQDYDLWVAPEDAPKLNEIAASFGLAPTRSAEEALRVGRYVLEGEDRVDVLLARSVSTVDGEVVHFEDVWKRRGTLWLEDHVFVNLPCLDDLIATKRFAARPKDIEDIRFLEALKAGEGPR
jgi:hypothetical protein